MRGAVPNTKFHLDGLTAAIQTRSLSSTSGRSICLRSQEPSKPRYLSQMSRSDAHRARPADCAFSAAFSGIGYSLRPKKRTREPEPVGNQPAALIKSRRHHHPRGGDVFRINVAAGFLPADSFDQRTASSSRTDESAAGNGDAGHFSPESPRAPEFSIKNCHQAPNRRYCVMRHSNSDLIGDDIRSHVVLTSLPASSDRISSSNVFGKPRESGNSNHVR